MGAYTLSHKLVAAHAGGPVVCLDERGIGRSYALHAERPSAALNERITAAAMGFGYGLVASEPAVSAGPARYEHIDFTPPKGVREAAKKGLELRKEHGRGGTEVGVARARDLANGRPVSPKTARRMKAYFDRHEADKQGEGWNPGEDGYPSAGKIAWLLWGGDPGRAWCEKLCRQMDAADEES